MKLVLNAKETFGELIYLGYADKMKYVEGRKTDIVEGRNVKLGSEILQEQIVILVPPTVDVESIKFAAPIEVGGKVTCDPYGTTSVDSSFAEVRLRCEAETLIDPKARAGASANANAGNKSS